jgi:hypothetical protein
MKILTAKEYDQVITMLEEYFSQDDRIQKYTPEYDHFEYLISLMEAYEQYHYPEIMDWLDDGGSVGQVKLLKNS